MVVAEAVVAVAAASACWLLLQVCCRALCGLPAWEQEALAWMVVVVVVVGVVLTVLVVLVVVLAVLVLLALLAVLLVR